jgi:hypothetical protein
MDVKLCDTGEPPTSFMTGIFFIILNVTRERFAVIPHPLANHPRVAAVLDGLPSSAYAMAGMIARAIIIDILKKISRFNHH